MRRLDISKDHAEFTVALTNIAGALGAVAVNESLQPEFPWIKKVKEMQKATEKLLQVESNACWRS